MAKNVKTSGYRLIDGWNKKYLAKNVETSGDKIGVFWLFTLTPQYKLKFKKLSEKRWNNTSWNLKYYAKNVETSGYRIIDGWNKKYLAKKTNVETIQVQI